MKIEALLPRLLTSTKTTMHGLWIRHAAVAATAIVAMGVLPAYAQLQTVVLAGDAAPEPSSVYKSFRQVDAGDLPTEPAVFFAKLGSLQGSVRGLFIDDPAAAGSTVVLRGTPAPTGQAFRRFRHASMNAIPGDVVWQSTLSGSGRGVFRSGPANVAVVGDPVLPGPGVLDRFGRSAVAENGDAAFQATISGGPVVGTVTVVEGVFRCSGGDGSCSGGTGILTTVARNTDPVPDRPGRFFCSFSERVGVGTAATSFRASTKLDCADLLEEPLDGVFRLPLGGVIETVALQGEPSNPSPGAGGTTYANFEGTPVMNTFGSVAFQADVAGVIGSEIIFRCDLGACPGVPADAMVRTGDADPDGNTVHDFESIGVNDAGDVSLYASVNQLFGRNGRGVYVKRAGTGTLERIAGRDDVVPDLVNTTFRKLFDPAMSAGGRVVFRAKIKQQGGGARSGVFLFE